MIENFFKRPEDPSPSTVSPSEDVFFQEVADEVRKYIRENREKFIEMLKNLNQKGNLMSSNEELVEAAKKVVDRWKTCDKDCAGIMTPEFKERVFKEAEKLAGAFNHWNESGNYTFDYMALVAPIAGLFKDLETKKRLERVNLLNAVNETQARLLQFLGAFIQENSVINMNNLEIVHGHFESAKAALLNFDNE